MSEWINFKELREKLNFEDVLRHFNVEVKKKGTQHHGYCPIPTHQGKRDSPSFSANLEKGIFQCFGCGAKGNILEFAAFMEKVDIEDRQALRSVALRLRDRFFPETKTHIAPSGKKEVLPEKTSEKPKLTVVNAPLDFELKGLDYNHPYLFNRGFTEETIEYFRLGYCSRGSLKDRLAIPLQDHEGKLIGFAGRVVDDKAIREDNPRYRFPGKREREGTIFDFRKTLFLYNGFRIKAPVDDLYVVEGFTSVWWFHQNHLRNTVATMGSDCSERQAALIESLVSPNGRVWLIPDGDEAGRRFAASALPIIASRRFVRLVWLRKETQPTDYSGEELQRLLRP